MERIWVKSIITKTLELNPAWVDASVWTKFKTSTIIEHSIWVKSNMTSDSAVYRANFNKVVTLLESPEIARAIVLGSITSATVIDIDPFEIWRKQEKEIVRIRQYQKIERKTSKAYKCGKCGYNETVYQEHQSRASDEANVVSVQCIRCNAMWRI